MNVPVLSPFISVLCDSGSSTGVLSCLSPGNFLVDKSQVPEGLNPKLLKECAESMAVLVAEIF